MLILFPNLLKLHVMNKLLFLLILLFSGCICTEVGYPEKNFFIKCRKEINPYVNYGIANEVQTIDDSFKIFNLHFYKARGGKSFIFGKVIKDTGNAYKEKRLALHENKEIQSVYSVEDILKFKTEKVDTMTVYLIPD
jgi:hypothetical protein